MDGLRILRIASAVAMLLGGCTANETGTTGAALEVPDAGKPKKVLCRVTGGGQIEAGENPDSFGGNAQPIRGVVQGEWEHQTHDDGNFHGDPDFIECFVVEGDPADPPSAPANAARFSGTGTLDGEECTFVVYVEDHGEPGTEDFYSIVITCPSGTYSEENELLSGNLQIHAVPPGHMLP